MQEITPMMLKTIEMILHKRNRAEVFIENGKIRIVEIKRKLRNPEEYMIQEQTEYERR